MRFVTDVDPIRTPTQPFRVYPALKPVFEFCLVCLALPLVVPLVLLLALIVMCDGGSPFYSQLRLGQHGRRFRIWKLRSMVPKADEKLAAYLQSNAPAKREWDRTQKLAKDPRVTRVGRILRRTSLDELPQLFNVLLGDMALVGPRPMLPEQAAQYPDEAYYRMRPGLTGLWQISGREHSAFVSRGTFDCIYENTLSFPVDMQIMLRTFGVVWQGCRPKRPKVLAVASQGGHWQQMQQLSAAFPSGDTVFVVAQPDGAATRADFQVIDCNQKTPIRALGCSVQLISLMLFLRPKTVITTGALPGALALLAARLVGAKTLWLDSVANAEKLSISGKLTKHVAHLHLSQWPEVAEQAGSTYKGSLL